MVVGRDYLLRKSTGPSAPRRFFDTRVIPRAVNMAGGVELAIDGVSRRTGVRPVLLLGLACATACAFGLRQRYRRISGRRPRVPVPD